MRPARNSWRGRESLPEVREGTVGPAEGPGGDGRPSWKCERVREALSEVWEWTRGPLGSSGGS